MNPLASAHLRVARPTDNIEALLPFYVDGLGMNVIFRFDDHQGFDGVMLGWNSEYSASSSAPAPGYHLELTTKRGHPVGRAPTQDNLLVFYLPNEQEFDVAVKRLVDAGFPPVTAFNPYWDACGKTFEDPDGYRVVLAKRESPV